MQLNFHCSSWFKIVSKIGEGSFSDVLKCQELETGSFYACKRLKKIYLSSKQMKDIPEVKALQKLGHHPNILHLLEAIYWFKCYNINISEPNPGYVIMVFELCDMSLYDLIKTKKRGISETKVRDYTYQLLRGLEFIHKNGLFHRDVKPENVLLKETWLKPCTLKEKLEVLTCVNKVKSTKKQVVEFSISEATIEKGNMIKLADLGSIKSINIHPPYTEYVSTRWYRSPECLLTTGYYGPKMDVWAVGCVFYELLTLKPLFPGTSELDQISFIHSIIGLPSSRTMEKFGKYRSYNYEFIISSKKSKNQIKNKSDHWGYGILLNKSEGFSPSTSLPSFLRHSQSPFDCLKLFSMVTNLSETGREVLKQMLTYDPDLRPSARSVIEHNYFNISRKSDITPRKFSCYAEIPRNRFPVIKTETQGEKVLTYTKYKEVSPRKFINKPTDAGDTKESYNIKSNVNKIAAKNLKFYENDDWHLPLIQEKYREDQIIKRSKNENKGALDPRLNKNSSYPMKKVFNKQNENLKLPKLNLKDESKERCEVCNKFKLRNNTSPKYIDKSKVGKCGWKVNESVNRPRYSNVNDITDTDVKVSLCQKHHGCYMQQGLHKKLKPMNQSKGTNSAVLKKPKVFSKLS